MFTSLRTPNSTGQVDARLHRKASARQELAVIMGLVVVQVRTRPVKTVVD